VNSPYKSSLTGAQVIPYRDLVALASSTITDAPCPLCGPGRRQAANRKRKTLRIWPNDGFASYYCARCGVRGWARAQGCSRTAGRPWPGTMIALRDYQITAIDEAVA
jgi:hypothetical protein